MRPHLLSPLSSRGARGACGITCALFIAMDLDRRKHDVDVIERVLGGIRDSGSSESEVGMRLLDVDDDLPLAGGSVHRTVVMTVGIEDTAVDRRRLFIGS